MSHTPPGDANPYQAYPNAGTGSGNYGQSGYPGASMNPNTAGVARSDQQYSAGPSVVSPFSPNLSPHFNATTGMLALLALVSLYEGTHRTIIYSNSGLPWDASGGDYFPAAALLAGAVWESIYSLMTLFIALWAILFDWHSVALTTLALGTQFVGWYTVVIFSLAQPAYAADKFNADNAVGTAAATNPLGYTAGSFNTDETRAAYVFGWLLPLFALNTALLAGMIFFTIQLMQIQMNNVNELHSPHYYGRRLTFWTLLEMLYGISTIIYAAIYLGKDINHYDNNSADYFYPNFTVWGSITLITGIMLTITAFLGFLSSCANNLHMSNIYIAMSWFSFLWVVGAHVMGQCGYVQAASNQAGFGLAELGLFFGVLLTGMYLAYKAATIETVHRGNYVMNNKGRNVVV